MKDALEKTGYPRVPRSLGNAKPFEYPDVSTGEDVTVLAAHGVNEQREARMTNRLVASANFTITGDHVLPE
ncbi:hypothetical protein [Paraburkholderia sp.]|uniref:hypothetical protein n=1 Tax=Paraburkholderia sp. TaxID=1926495 RepID=UPI0039E313BB